MKKNLAFPTTLLALLCLGLLQQMHAVSLPPDGCYPNFTTAEGCDALDSLTTGAGNTGLGWRSLFLDATGNYNTGVGAGALALNNGESNTAVGAAALLLNTTGFNNTATGTNALVYNDSGNSNTADGAFALFFNTATGNTATGASAMFSNTTGSQNTASGAFALFNNTTGTDNTANGFGALYTNTDGFSNTAIGFEPLYSNTTGAQNTAIGRSALSVNTAGSNNNAVGVGALENNDTGDSNVGIGTSALEGNATGDSNTAIGDSAGSDITGSGNVCIGAGITGVAGESNITRIRNVYESAATERAVYVTSDNRIGTLSSSRRYKEEIAPMAKASEAIHSLRPVTFRYKKEVDSARMLSFGLIAEEVAMVSRDLVTSDREGNPEAVRYEAINAMLLNEFLKEHQKVEEQQAAITGLKSVIAGQQKEFQAAIAEQRKQFEVRLSQQDEKIQRVNDRIELTSPAHQAVAKNE